MEQKLSDRDAENVDSTTKLEVARRKLTELQRIVSQMAEQDGKSGGGSGGRGAGGGRGGAGGGFVHVRAAQGPRCAVVMRLSAREVCGNFPSSMRTA